MGKWQIGKQTNRLSDYPTAPLRDCLATFLAAHTTIALATVGADGIPAAAAVFYAHDNDLNLYFLSEECTQHGQNLLANSAVAGTIQADGQDWRVIRGIQVRGVAKLVPFAQLPHAATVYGRKFAFVAAQEPKASSRRPPVGYGLVTVEGPAVLAGPLARARFWVLRPSWFRLIDNTVRFGFKEELVLSVGGHSAS